jgi:hypothetical protein
VCDNDIKKMYQTNRHNFSHEEDSLIKLSLDEGHNGMIKIAFRHPLEVARRVNEL